MAKFIVFAAIVMVSASVGHAQTAPPASVTPSSPEARFYAKLAIAPRMKTKAIGGPGGGRFEAFKAEGGVLVGLEVSTGSYAGHTVISGIRPIFQTLAGRVKGERYGAGGETTVTLEAREGYAVSQVNISGGDRLDGLELQYWRIAAGSGGLDAAGAYKSEWVGGKGGAKARSPLSGNGNPVVGVFGGAGSEIDRLGLITSKTR